MHLHCIGPLTQEAQGFTLYIPVHKIRTSHIYQTITCLVYTAVQWRKEATLNFFKMDFYIDLGYFLYALYMMVKK